MDAHKQFTETVTVDRPVRTVYNQWTQFEEFPEFMEGVERVEQLDDTHLRWTTEIGLVSKSFETEISEQIPDEIIMWRATGGDVAHAGKVTFAAAGPQQTEVTVNMAWQPESFAEKVADWTNVTERRVKGDLERFKAFIESRDAETGAHRETHV
ncbi:SRPBCC family protein [Euzebya sp.]|uniref:SRPBCC family protein n=1 Tax=Euzebya sp. TaxID=1971409 RepID=UPI0035112E86